MDKKIIVDIDNTLWDLAPVLFEHLRRLNPQVPDPDQWRDWDFWEPYVSLRELYGILREIHSRQDQYPPYREARPFLNGLKEKAYHITIASHRERGTLEPTVLWLRQNGLAFDEIHLLHDKTVLFEHHFAIVDDSPVTLEKAARAGLIRAGLRSPWNRHTRHPLFASLMEILAYVEEAWKRKERGRPVEQPL